MKLKKDKTKKAIRLSTNKDGTVRIHHHQTIRQSLDYQSAELGYGIDFDCDPDPESIEMAIAKAEKIVERAMLPKFKEQGKLLNNLSKK